MGLMESAIGVFALISEHRRVLFADSSVGKQSTFHAGDPDSVPGLGRYPGEGKGVMIIFKAQIVPCLARAFKKK